MWGAWRLIRPPPPSRTRSRSGHPSSRTSSRSRRDAPSRRSSAARTSRATAISQNAVSAARLPLHADTGVRTLTRARARTGRGRRRAGWGGAWAEDMARARAHTTVGPDPRWGEQSGSCRGGGDGTTGLGLCESSTGVRRGRLDDVWGSGANSG